MVETEFSVVRFRGDVEKAKNVYRGIDPLTPQDIAELVLFATSRPTHVEISAMTVFPNGQASATLRKA
ncbi:putative oxidoreductase [Smittium mucronatum]|uniref:Putative oxidoreductase n=1 Tax=Smittium mucronatum TaxID=133383 RepID=A0A1R0GYQ1_9FUNG|nr:putative oxidoreductase [Smittium mucronatum]